MSTLTGLGAMIRIVARRSRWFWVIWILALVGLVPATAGAYEELIAQGPDSQTMLEGLRTNPTMRAILGVPFDLTTKGGFAFWRVGGFTAWAAAAMAGWGVIRLTRGEEDAGRGELVRAGAVGRHAHLAATLIVAALACCVLGLGVIVGLLATDTSAVGAFASGVSIAASGCMFAGIGAVMAQIFDNARAATGWCVGIVFGGLYLVRAVVDASSDGENLWMWVNPLEWPTLMRPYAQERWWVALLPLVFGVAATALAMRLESVRDHGAGLRATRLGKARASRWLSGAHSLAWRQHRGGVFSWLTGMGVCAVTFGIIGLQMDEIIAQNPGFAKIITRMGGGETIRLSFLSAIVSILAVVVALAGVRFLATARGEEKSGRSEQLLACSTSRVSFLLSHLVYGLVFCSVLLALVGGLVALPQLSEQDSFALVTDFTTGGLVLLPGLWLIVGFGCFLLGWAPRFFALTWTLVAWSLFCSWFASLLNVPEWLTKLEPFGYLPRLPIDEMSWTPVLVELCIAVALVIAGFVGYRQRDMPVP